VVTPAVGLGEHDHSDTRQGNGWCARRKTSFARWNFGGESSRLNGGLSPESRGLNHFLQSRSHLGAQTTHHGSKEWEAMKLVRALNNTPRLAEFDRNKGCYMLVRGTWPTGSLPVAAFDGDDGSGFAVREIDQAEIALSYDYTVAWITTQKSSAGEARGLASLAREALNRAGICFTSAADVAHEHLFIPSEKAPEAMVMLDEVERKFRMIGRES
jgi:hypothetical protein